MAPRVRPRTAAAASIGARRRCQGSGGGMDAAAGESSPRRPLQPSRSGRDSGWQPRGAKRTDGKPADHGSASMAPHGAVDGPGFGSWFLSRSDKNRH